MKLLSLITLCFFLLLPAIIMPLSYSPWVPPSESPTEVLIDSFKDTPNIWLGFWTEYFAPLSGSANYAMQGQSFAVSNNYYISRVNFTLTDNIGSPEATLKVALFSWNVTDGRVFGYNSIPNKPFGKGEELANSDGISVLLAAQTVELSFEFTGENRYELIAGTAYGIGVYVDVNVTFGGSNYFGVSGNSGLKAVHEGNRFTQYNATYGASPTSDAHFAVYGFTEESYEGYWAPTNTNVWVTGVFAPYVYMAISIWSLALIVGVGAVLYTQQTDAMPIAIIYGIAITIVLLIALMILAPFLGV